MYPITNLNAKLQKEVWLKNVQILEDLGFEVVVVTLTDGNEVNHKFFKDIFKFSKITYKIHLIPAV